MFDIKTFCLFRKCIIAFDALYKDIWVMQSVASHLRYVGRFDVIDN